jgi:hypothetical protein
MTMADEPTSAQWQAAELKAARHNRWLDRWFPAAMMILTLALIVAGAVILGIGQSGPCFDASRVSPIWQGTTAAGQPAAEFQVPEKSWAVVHMDGFYQVIASGRSYGLNQGVFVCNSPEEAQKRAAQLNTELAP